MIRSEFDYLVAGNPLSESLEVSSIAGAMDRQACRHAFDLAGFSLLKLGTAWDSRGLRRLMVELLDALSLRHEERMGTSLLPLSMSRFNQQVTTKPHRDGGPAESLLLLGYEPSRVASRLSIADYSHCANDLGLSPVEFLDRHNPMFADGAKRLADYTTPVSAFDPAEFQILLINNSCAPYDVEQSQWQGVLHEAVVPHPQQDAFRVINSIHVTPLAANVPPPVTSEERERFLTDDALGTEYGKIPR